MNSTQSGEDKRAFHTLILDAWSEPGDSLNEITWRFRLRNVRTGSTKTFATKEALAAYLNAHFRSEAANR